jgi:hypothetical protein
VLRPNRRFLADNYAPTFIFHALFLPSIAVPGLTDFAGGNFGMWPARRQTCAVAVDFLDFAGR